MTSTEIRQKFLQFFEDRGHKIAPSSSLVPENDPSVLFTTAGMQQFKPYYLGESSPFGNKVATVQKCVRTSDIDEVGDNTHLTFFEMLGNFAFSNAVSKREAIIYSHDFITKELGLEISYVTFYKGAGSVGRDDESEKIWKELGLKDVREEGADVFWGPTGDSGPCGPTTEIYCKNAAGKDVEIWNIVFNQYFCEGSREKLDKGEAILKELPTFGIDTGMGLERLLTIIQKKESVYETDLFNNEKTKEERIIADHIRTSIFMISDGVRPSNTDRGYILRRLIRRAVVHAHKLGRESDSLIALVDLIVSKYKGLYALEGKITDIKNTLITEIDKFKKTLEKGLKEFEKGIEPFILFTTYGFPLELTLELAKEKGIKVDVEDFNNKMAEHQKLSQTASGGMFKGGLADHDPKTIRLHTAHHLLLAALKKVLGEEVKQRGSNITHERLRLDFAFGRKLTDEEKKKVEDLVNEKIKEGLNVVRKEMPKAEAEKLGAEMEFGAKYGDMVSVYFIGPLTSLGTTEKAFSVEFCGGPHVSNTSELGYFKIQKEEAVSAGTRRIKAVLG